jgi:hypothetical protein
MAGGLAGLFGRTYYRLYRRFTRNAEEAAKSPSGPTPDAAEAPWRDLSESAEETDATFRKAAGDKAKQDFVKSLSKGSNLNWLERWGMKMVNGAFDLADRLRKWLFKPRAGVKTAIAVGSAALVAAAASRLYYGVPPSPPPPPPGPVNTETNSINGIVIPTPLPDIPPPPADLALSDQEMTLAFDGLGILSLEQMGREHVDLDVSDLPLPPVIAAASAAPVAAEVQRGDATYSTSTTVGEVYRSLPEDARAQFEERIRESTSDDHGIQLKDNFTVSSPIGSLTISTN